MTIRNLPVATFGVRAGGSMADALQERAIEAWDRNIQARSTPDSDFFEIDVLEVIGEDPWSGGGVTAAKVSALLRSAQGRDVMVNINSPGGRFFEGAAIYNALRTYKGRVVTRVLGIAASAASIVALAGDEIQIGRLGFVMIHNTRVGALADQHGFRELADVMAEYDEALADLYVGRTGQPRSEIIQLMNAEKVMTSRVAIEKGFADGLLSADLIDVRACAENPGEVPKVAYQVEALAIRAGKSRSEARAFMRKVLTEVSGMPSAADDGTPRAAEEAAIAALLATAKSTRIEA